MIDSLEQTISHHHEMNKRKAILKLIPVSDAELPNFLQTFYRRICIYHEIFDVFNTINDCYRYSEDNLKELYGAMTIMLMPLAWWSHVRLKIVKAGF